MVKFYQVGLVKTIRYILCALVSFAVSIIIVFQLWVHANDQLRRFRSSSFGNIGSYRIELNKPNTTKLLTLATTFCDRAEKEYIYRNTIINLGLLAPEVQPVLFVKGNRMNNLTTLAVANGWKITSLRRTHKSGVPFLKDMFKDIQKNHESTFYGYMNGDILFDQRLVETLSAVKQYFHLVRNILVTGRRINYKMRGEKIDKLDQVVHMSVNGTLFAPNAEDYFITTYNGFPWPVLKDVVIGKPAYDNYVVAMGIQNNATVIDATKTVMALHQTGRDGNYAGHKKDPTVNTGIIGNFNYTKGLTSCAQWFTDLDASGNIYCFKTSGRC